MTPAEISMVIRHPGGGGQQPGNQQASVTVPVAVPPGPPTAQRRGHGLHEQPERGDTAGDAGGERQERGDHAGRHGRSREDQRRPELAAGSQAGQQAGLGVGDQGGLPQRRRAGPRLR